MGTLAEMRVVDDGLRRSLQILLPRRVVQPRRRRPMGGGVAWIRRQCAGFIRVLQRRQRSSFVRWSVRVVRSRIRL